MDPTSELVRRSIDGDSEAFDCLVREYMNTVVGLAFNYVGNFHTAEDLAQETFVQAFQSLERLRDGTRFKVWLLRIARNKCIDYIRRSPRWLSIDHDHELQREVSTKVATPFSHGEEASRFSEADLFSALNSLRNDYREIFLLKHVDNLSYKEISGLLGMTVSAVGEKLYRVRAMIREKLEDIKSGSNNS
jgi:RNA polymerase sigma-70 factor (ECF subfamily)